MTVLAKYDYMYVSCLKVFSGSNLLKIFFLSKDIIKETSLLRLPLLQVGSVFCTGLFSPPVDEIASSFSLKF